MRKLVLSGIFIALLVVGLTGGIVYQQGVDQQLAQNAAIAQMNHDQSLIYQATIAA